MKGYDRLEWDEKLLFDFIREYRDREFGSYDWFVKKDGSGGYESRSGVLVLTGDPDIAYKITSPMGINGEMTQYQRELKAFMQENRGREIVSDRSLMKDFVDLSLYEANDGASNIYRGRLEGAWLFVEDVRSLKGLEKLGARHKAGAHASLYGLKSLVLSHKTGKITVFDGGKDILDSEYAATGELDSEGTLQGKACVC